MASSPSVARKLHFLEMEHLTQLLTSPQAWVAFATLAILEIVLGIDNIVFISILANKLPEEQRKKAWNTGLSVALVSRILLLLGIGYVMTLTFPVVTIPGLPVTAEGAHGLDGALSVRDLILLLGGLFLIGKATHEIHAKLEGSSEEGHAKVGAASFGAVIAQIFVIDLVFSLDSVITAVGMADDIAIMIAAVVVAVGFMLVFASKVGDFVHKHPTVTMLALAFLVLIGVNLVAEGLGEHIPKGYTYVAMAFSVLVEMLNMKLRKKTEPVELHYGSR
jgi:predicted tellurium resistance membrane protein TerC